MRIVTLGALMLADRHYTREKGTASLFELQCLNYFNIVYTLYLQMDICNDTNCVLVGVGKHEGI